MAETEKRGSAGPAQLRLDLEGYEGPLDVMLHLAQAKKLDLSKISVLALAAQYLRFLRQARQLDLAGEYLLMAAALVYMKSRLALPQQRQERAEAEESAERLRFRLERLAAFRAAAEKLFRRDLLGQALFACGAPREPRIKVKTEYQADLSGLLSAYARVENRRQKQILVLSRAPVFWPLAEAQQSVAALLAAEARQSAGASGPRWLDLTQALAKLAVKSAGAAEGSAREKLRRSMQASGFAAVLELARQGKAELRQTRAFSPLYARGLNKTAAQGA